MTEPTTDPTTDPTSHSAAEPAADPASADPRHGHGILGVFGSLVTAQAIGALLGLVFWVTVARLVPTGEVGVAAAAINTQTLLGSITSLGIGTLLIAELPGLGPAARGRLVRRGLVTVGVTSAVAAGVLALCAPLLSANLRAALDHPVEVLVFVAGVAAAAAALVVDQAGLGLGRARVQVGRNLLASSLRFPLAAALLALGERSSVVLQICWVAPLLLSVAVSLRRFRLGARRTDGVPFLADLGAYAAPALRNHALNLALAAGSQLVPVVAALALLPEDNATFAIAWLLATFVFLPPYLLATALFAHGANLSAADFRESMRTTVPAALSVSLVLCLGAWVAGPLVLRVFGADYADTSPRLLAILVPAGLWMVLKDHLVAFWRSQRQYRLGVALTLVALALEVTGAAVGGLTHGATGLCAGWLAASGVEVLVFAPWLRRVMGGLAWRAPWHLLRPGG